jgi:hypothetical protein
VKIATSQGGVKSRNITIRSFAKLSAAQQQHHQLHTEEEFFLRTDFEETGGRSVHTDSLTNDQVSTISTCAGGPTTPPQPLKRSNRNLGTEEQPQWLFFLKSSNNLQ